MTVEMWCERVVCELREPARLRPSGNWMVYASLLRRLREEGCVGKVAVRRVADRDFVRFVRWLLKERKGRGFLGVMKSFTALINRARKARLTRYVADFPYRDYAPRSRSAAGSAADVLAAGGTVRSLSPDQWQAFLSLDLSRVRIVAGPRMAFWKEVFRDFCRLLYELKSRPIDVLQLHAGNFAVNPANGRTLCSYVPAKKRNRNSAPVVQYLSPAALALVEKYRGKSRGGYVFPFAMNGRRWNLDNPSQFRSHYAMARNQLARINVFLHRAGEVLGLPFPFTLYAVRRTAITHALIEGSIPIHVLAKMAGTSVRMLEAHYINFLHALDSY